MKAKKKTVNKKVDQIKSIKRRNGEIVPFDLNKITIAISKAMTACSEGSEADAKTVSLGVFEKLLLLKKDHSKGDFVPNVEMIQDLVEKELIAFGCIETARAYILYRNQRSMARSKFGDVPEKVKKLALDSKNYFQNSLGEFVYYRTYSRWIEEEQRRETWIETVERFISFMQKNLGKLLKESEYKELKEAILSQKIMPSMRLMQFSGKPAERTNVCAYNCSFIAPNSLKDFAEIMYILMCGTGVGFSVESQNVHSLPQIKFQSGKKIKNYVIEDSKEGWADALTHGIKTWFDGEDTTFDYSKLRPAGARLKTMGGKSSGPEPLRQLMVFVREKILKRQGKRLSNLDVHDIICKIGEIVVSGGVRRSALISLSDLDDESMRDAKKGQFWVSEGQRALANNSAVYLNKPSATEFMDEWIALMKSGSGERGIFNRGGLAKTLPERRLAISKGYFEHFGTNPCGEIILRSKQFCNLSEIIARAEDTEETLMEKMRLATILGTYQSTLVNFPYLSKEWSDNCKEERLLGVSITGQWDCKTVRNPKILEKLKNEAIKVNKMYAKRFGVNQSSCITCVKPSGTVSQTFDCSSGMHTRYAPYYIRRIRIAATDSLFKMLRDQGMPYFAEVGQSVENATTYVLEFPVKSPKGAIVNKDLSALDQLEYWKMVKENYTEHNPSITIYVSEDEWIAVANWLYQNWEIIGGLSFLPRTDHVYQLAPYEEITEKQYLELSKKIEHIDFSKIMSYEKEDETEVKKELACVSGVCDII